MSDNEIKLNLGCGDQLLEGWINIDLHYIHPAVIRDDLTKLSKIGFQVNLIYCSNSLIYVPPEYDLMTFARWYELLKDRGELYLEEPQSKEEWENLKYIRDPESVTEMLTRVGFSQTATVPLPKWSRHSSGYCIKAIK